jgi:hypothetical protein
VTNNLSIIEKVIPFFDKFSFLSAKKKKNFSIFKQIVQLVKDNQHLNPEGFNEIVNLREGLNEGKGRTRKYNKNDALIQTKESSETER